MFSSDWVGCKAINSDSTIYICTQANHMEGKCHYCLCLECWTADNEQSGGNGRLEKYKDRSQRSKKQPTPTKILHEKCVHKIHDLKSKCDTWWCKLNYIGKEKWYMYPHGCVKCKQLFVNIGKGRKIELPPNFVFPAEAEFDKYVLDQIRRRKGGQIQGSKLDFDN